MLLIKQNQMSKQENASSKPQGLAPSTTPSRITRTNPNSNSRLISNPPLDPFLPTEESKLKNLPNKVSALDKNIMFQDMDKDKTLQNQSANSSRSANTLASNTQESDKAIGLISNVFLGATNRFVKGTLNNASTPTKVEQIVQEQQDTNKVTPAKFARNREAENKARTISMKEPVPQPTILTDRSGAEGGKKIQRRQGTAQRQSRQLKFTEKKEEKVEEIPEKITSVVITSARKTEAKVEAFKTETIKTEQVTEEVPRVYQPIQRSTPYARSRIVSQQTPLQKQPVVTQTPKEAPKPATNRLVQSRLQSQQLLEPKVAEEKQVKPVSTINKTSESRLVTQIAPTVHAETVQPKEEIKPKPYSRSFINKRTEIESQQKNVSTIVSQTTTVETTIVTKNTQQSKINDTKNKSQLKQVVPELSEVKVLLKKSYCIALIGKRLVRARLLEGFDILRSHKRADKVKKVNECNILCSAMSQIVKLKEGNLIKLALESIKKKFTAAYISSLQAYANEAPSNYKNALATILDRLYSSKMRQNFKTVKQSLEKFKTKSKCALIFEAFVRQKMRQQAKRSFDAIKLRQSNLFHQLTQFSNIFLTVNKAKLVFSFSKIVSFKPTLSKVTTTPAKQPIQRSRVNSKLEQAPTIINTSDKTLAEKLQKLKKSSAVLQTEIGGLQANVAKKKKGSDNQKGTLQEKVTVLKQQNQQANNEIQIKKHRNSQIKKEMENIPPKGLRGLEEELGAPRDSKLQLLTNIYISNFKQPQEPVLAEELLSTYNLKAEDGSVLFHEWAKLKRFISAYEGVDPKENKGRTSILGEQALVGRLIRSYIKEQYFWHWIHLSAQAS